MTHREEQAAEVRCVECAQIRIPERGMRRIDEETIAKLTMSIQMHGQLHPCIVTPKMELVVGFHRYETQRRSAGLLLVRVMDMDEISKERIRLEENLCRSDLSQAEQARDLARLKEYHEARYPETKRGGTAASRQEANGKFGHHKNQNGSYGSAASFVATQKQQRGYSRSKTARLVRIGQAFTDEELLQIESAKLPLLDQDFLAGLRSKGTAGVDTIFAGDPKELRKRATAVIAAERGKPPIARKSTMLSAEKQRAQRRSTYTPEQLREERIAGEIRIVNHFIECMDLQIHAHAALRVMEGYVQRRLGEKENVPE